MSKDIVNEIFRANQDSLSPEEFYKIQIPLYKVIDDLFAEREKRHGEVEDVLNGLLGLEAENIAFLRRMFHAGKNTVAKAINRSYSPDIVTVQDVQSAMKWRGEIQEQINRQLILDINLINKLHTCNAEWMSHTLKLISTGADNTHMQGVDALLVEIVRATWGYLTPTYLLLVMSYSLDLSLLNKSLSFKKDGTDWFVAGGETALVIAAEATGAGLAKKGIKEILEKQQTYINNLAAAGNLYARVRHYDLGLQDLAKLIPYCKDLRESSLRLSDALFSQLDDIKKNLPAF